MEEQDKNQEAKKCCCCGVNTKGAVKIILGLGLITLGVWAIIAWFPNLLALVKGAGGLFLFLAGIVVIILARE